MFSIHVIIELEHAKWLLYKNKVVLIQMSQYFLIVSMVLISFSSFSFSAQRPNTVSDLVGRGWMNLESTGLSALCHLVSQLIRNLHNNFKNAFDL